MKSQPWLAPFACALSLAAPLSQAIFAQEAIPDIRAAQPDGKAATIIVFDVPGETCQPENNPCSPIGIDDQDTVFGQYNDSTGASRGFYRLSDGTIGSLYLPLPGSPPSETNLLPLAVNSRGTLVVVASGETQEGVSIGGDFIRDSVGHYTEFLDFSTEQSFVYSPSAINSAGVITGKYYDLPDQTEQAFVRDAEGNYTVFDVPGIDNLVETVPASINSSGDIVGYTLIDHFTSFQRLGFLRESGGQITKLAPERSKYVIPSGINDDGLVIGSFGEDTYDCQGFIRDAQGNYKYFTVPVSGVTGTIPVAVDPQGAIVGYYYSSLTEGAFYRQHYGAFGFFAPLGSAATYPTAINSKGDIAGYFYDAAGALHNFVRINPDPPATSTAQNANAGPELAQ